MDATYKANAHKLSLVNIVGNSSVSSVKGINRSEKKEARRKSKLLEHEEMQLNIDQKKRNLGLFVGVEALERLGNPMDELK